LPVGQYALAENPAVLQHLLPVSIYVPLALKLHASGLFKLQHSEWCGTELYDHAKRHYRGRAEPRTLFQEPLADGFLFQLGTWIFDDYISSDDFFHTQDFEFLHEYMEDFVQVLLLAGVPVDAAPIRRTQRFLHYLDRLHDRDEEAFERARSSGRHRLQTLHERLHESFSDVVSSVRLVYARDYAERVFHDRQLCAYIAQLILDIGIDGTIDDEPPGQWCPRLSFPAWVRQSLTARDRGQCANCGANIVGELQGVIHIDHIVPLVRGGCNDIVNLQILCDTCNRQKSAELWSAKSSIPPYLERALAKRRA